MFFLFSLISSHVHTSLLKAKVAGSPWWLPLSTSFYMGPKAVHCTGLWVFAGHQQWQWQKVSTNRWLLAESPACQWLTTLISGVSQGKWAEQCQLLCSALLAATCQGTHMVHTTYRESWIGDGCGSPTVIQGMPDSAGWCQLKCHRAKYLGAFLRGHPTISQKIAEGIRELKVLRLCSNITPLKVFGNQVLCVSNENDTLKWYTFSIFTWKERSHGTAWIQQCHLLTEWSILTVCILLLDEHISLGSAGFAPRIRPQNWISP